MWLNPFAVRASLPLLFVITLFFLWGMANHLNEVLSLQFKKIFTLSDFKASLVQATFYFGYFIFAIPAAFYMKRYGYQSGVVFGLLLYGAGALLFYPAAQAHQYGFFLLSLFVIASGLVFLETSANPLIIAMGDPITAERRLNFAQSFNPLGAVAGILIGREYILSDVKYTDDEILTVDSLSLMASYKTEIQSIQSLYIIIGLAVWIVALCVLRIKFPRVALIDSSQGSGAGIITDFKYLLNERYFLMGITAQFFYVGAQVCVFSFIMRYGQEAIPAATDKQLTIYVFYALLAFMIGRFIATALMIKIKACSLLYVFSLVNVGLCLLSMINASVLGLLFFTATSFFMSLMFPTIFALSIKNLGTRAKAGAALLIMAIIGGGLITMLMGFISDLTSIASAVIVPLFCFVVIAKFAYISCQREQSAHHD